MYAFLASHTQFFEKRHIHIRYEIRLESPVHSATFRFSFSERNERDQKGQKSFNFMICLEFHAQFAWCNWLVFFYHRLFRQGFFWKKNYFPDFWAWFLATTSSETEIVMRLVLVWFFFVLLLDFLTFQFFSIHQIVSRHFSREVFYFDVCFVPCKMFWFVSKKN